MRRGLRISSFALALGWALACRDNTAAPSGSAHTATPAPPKTAPTVVRLAIVPDNANLPLSSALSFAAYKILSDSSRLPINAIWSSSNDQVLTIGAGNGHAVVVGGGSVAVVARVDGLTAVAAVTVLGPASFGPSDALVVDSFSMVEFQYASHPGYWNYAPQMRAHATPGHTASVLVIRFSLPGFGNIPSFSCGARLGVTPNDLFGEVYGDWLLAIDHEGERPTGETATATITFLDEAGTSATRVVTGPIVPGSLPATYTGGANGGACFHGYGSSG